MEQDEKFDNQFNLALDLTKEERERSEDMIRHLIDGRLSFVMQVI